MGKLEAPDECLASQVDDEVGALVPKKLEIWTDVVWYGVAINVKDVDNLVFNIKRVESYDLKDHRKEDHSIGRYEHIH